jgi:hypothetical protein
MTENKSFVRKIIYIVIIAVLLLPLYMIGRPASVDAGGAISPGGVMAEKRDEYGLSQATLGAIDPASETAKLATLGLRGVAVVMLWNRAQHYQMVEDWTSLKATLEQIIRLQPNFFHIWDFQAHNLSYNISVEFDDYRDRFFWVMQGIEFFKKGLEWNKADPRFPAKVGWFYGNKIGKADEKTQYRRLFKKEQEEKGEKETDNWLVSYDWYREGQKLVDSGKRLRVYIHGHQGASQTKPGERAPGPLLFHNNVPMALITYAETLEEEGVIGNEAKTAWQNAAESWGEYIKRDLQSSYGYSVQIANLEMFRGDIEKHEKALKELLPGTYEEIQKEKREKLTDTEKAVLAKQPAERTADETNIAYNAEQLSKVTWDEVALRAPADKREAARDHATAIADLEQQVNTIDTYRDIVNYNYWNERCRIEPTDAAIEARTAMRDAAAAHRKSDLLQAKELYEQSFKKWDEVLKDSPILRTNSIMADDICEEINKYKRVLGQLGSEELPKDFGLQDLIDLNEGKQPAEAHKHEAGDAHHDHDHEKSAGKKDADSKKSADEKQPAEDKKGTDEQADKKADAKNADEKKADETQAGEKKSDEKQAADSKQPAADAKSTDEKKSSGAK